MRRLWMLVALGALAAWPLACSTTYERRDPTGERFPTVTGETLEKNAVTLPDDLAGEPALLIVGYKQRTQFDVDRWLLGLAQSQTTIRLYEVPTLPGALARVASGFIDNGMRSGIPEEDWKLVVTLYSDARPVAKFTGTENGLPARVLLLDRDGVVRWFHDRGYSVGTLQSLREAIAAVKTR